MNKIFLSALILILPIAHIQAQTVKIAVIDMAKVFQDYEKTKINEIKLKQQADIYKEHATVLSTELQKLNDEFTKLRNESQSIVLTEAERENRRLAAVDKYNQVQLKDREYKDYNRDKQKELRDSYDTKRAEILKEIQTVVRNRCMLEGYKLVLDSSGMTLNNIATVIYFSPEMDITVGVLDELNRGIRLNAKTPVDTSTQEKTEKK